MTQPSTFRQIICRLFHKKIWEQVGTYSNNIFDYKKYLCWKCETTFWDTPFDPHVEEEAPYKLEPKIDSRYIEGDEPGINIDISSYHNCNITEREKEK